MNNSFFYQGTNIKVKTGDIVLIYLKEGYVEKVCLPKTEEAKSFGFFDSGVILIQSPDYGLLLWKNTDEDLEFIRRKEKNRKEIK